MISIIIIIICILFVTICTKKEFKHLSIDLIILGSIIGLMFGAIISLLLLLATTSWSFVETGYIHTGDVPIVSIKTDGDKINGNFFLGSGFINSQKYYFSMQKLGENTYKPVQVCMDDVDAIEENDSVKPEIMIYTNTITNKYSKYIIFSDLKSTNNIYRIIVPKGTVITKYEVN